MNDKFFDLKREKQDRMINAGLKVFAKNGYRHAATDEIVREAAISKGLLFHYFTNKVGAYVFLMDYSVRYMLLELARYVNKEETDFFAICRQIEKGKLQVLRNYPYMQVFLDKAFEEQCLEALEESEEQKEAYLSTLEGYLMQAKLENYHNEVTHEKLIELYKYITRGVTAEYMAQDAMQPEHIHDKVCEYLELLEKLA